MTEVAKMSVVPVVVVRVHTVVHVFRIPGGKILLTKSAAILSFCSDDGPCWSETSTPKEINILTSRPLNPWQEKYPSK